MDDPPNRDAAALATRDNDARWRSLMLQSADAVVIADPRTNLISWVSPSVTRLSGWQPPELIGRSARSLVHPEDMHLLASALQVILNDPAAQANVEFRLLRPDGSFRWVEETMTNLVDEPGVHGLVANIRDITPRREAEEALRASEARYRLIAETAQEGIWATDSRGATLYANQKMADLVGRPLADFYTCPSHQLVSSVTRESVVERQSSRGPLSLDTYDLSHHHPDGSWRMLQVSASPLVEEGSYLGSLAMITDVTESRRAEQELVYRASHDPLTGLVNRTLLLERLQESLDRSRSACRGAVAVLVADIDEFKLVNDSFGHAAGDQLLVEVSRRWEQALGQQGLVARFGGDEFVVLCNDAGERTARTIAAQLLQTLVAPIDLGGRAVTVSASIGIAGANAAEADRPDASEILRFADAAMYQAKAGGRGRTVVFDHSLIDRAQTQLRMFNELKKAIESDQLVLHYQPVVELTTGHLLGVEALCRWVHPERGSVPPSEFIPMAEETGLINQLDDWVLRRAASEGALLRATGVLGDSAYVAVNVSAGHLAHIDYESTVRQVLLATGFPASALILEVTESAVMQDPDAAQIVLERLHALGVAIAIDDFGTGYSSLAYLRRFPVATLKVDRGFVQKLTLSADDRAIVTAIVDLARALNLRVTAEGVETIAELRLLRQRGCHAGQGFLWSPALPACQLTQLITELPQGRFAVYSSDFGVAATVAAPRGRLLQELRVAG